LNKRCALCAKRLALTHGKREGDLYDKHLMQTFLHTLEKRHHLRETDGNVSVHADLNVLEAKARTLLQEQSRHAILNAALQSVS
jgi:glycerol-3-phosphate O-acyltransferase